MVLNTFQDVYRDTIVTIEVLLRSVREKFNEVGN